MANASITSRNLNKEYLIIHSLPQNSNSSPILHNLYTKGNGRKKCASWKVRQNRQVDGDLPVRYTLNRFVIWRISSAMFDNSWAEAVISSIDAICSSVAADVFSVSVAVVSVMP